MNQRLRNELSLFTGAAALYALNRRNKNAALALGGLTAALRFLPTLSPYSFNQRHVLITGGSRGLGLALAYQLIKEGARVTLLARDAHELVEAAVRLRSIRSNAEVAPIVCDLSKKEEIILALNRAHTELGRIDAVINNAGAISFGPIETMELSDYRALLDVHLNAVIEITHELIPYFKKWGGGRIVNISSIGGKIPVPHMAPYCASKFALAGFSRSAAVELAEYGITITTVYPGLMRTGSPIQAVFKGDHEKEFAWFAAGDLIPGLSMSADRAARQILNAAREGVHEVVLSVPAKFGTFMDANFPELTSAVLKMVAVLLPHGRSFVRKTGAESMGWFKKRIWSKPMLPLQENAQERFNQEPKSDAEFNLGV